MADPETSARTALRPAPAVVRYFRHIHPARGSPLAALGFRAGEASTLRFLAGLELPLRQATILDYGCGDGQVLATLLRDAHLPASVAPKVRLEDLDTELLDQARRAVLPYASSVTLVDVCQQQPEDVHDIVLALGVLDYLADWRAGVAALAARTKRSLVVTMPAPQARSVVRRGWLRMHGLRSNFVTTDELGDVLGDAARIVVENGTVRCHWHAPQPALRET